MSSLCPLYQTTPGQYNNTKATKETNSDAVEDCISPLYDNGHKKKILPQTHKRWQIAAIVVSYISMIITLTLVLINFIVAGVADSSAAFGAGLDTLLSILSSLVIVWRYTHTKNQPEIVNSNDHKATVAVITMFLLGSLTIFIVATKGILDRSSVHSPDSVMTIFTAAAVCYIFLYFVKSIISKRLNSIAVTIDAVDSLAAGVTSIAVICGAVAVKYLPKLWFIDESIALCIAVVMAIYGARMLYDVFVPKHYVVGLLSDQDRD